MIYYKDTNNKPFVFEDNVTDEIITKVEATHNTTLTKITKEEFNVIKAPTFEQLQSKKLSEIKSSYLQANQQDIAYMDTTFQADSKSQALIVSVLSAGSVPDGFYWLDIDNNQVSMSYADLQGLSGIILERSQSNFTKLQDLKKQVKDATTQDDLDSIVW